MIWMLIAFVSVVAMVVALAWGMEQRRMCKIAETLNKELIGSELCADRARESLKKLYDERMVHLQNAHRKIKRVQAENHTLRGMNRELNREMASALVELEGVRGCLADSEQCQADSERDCANLLAVQNDWLRERNAYDHAFGVMDDEIRNLDSRLAELADAAADMIGGLVLADQPTLDVRPTRYVPATFSVVDQKPKRKARK